MEDVTTSPAEIEDSKLSASSSPAKEEDAREAEPTGEGCPTPLAWQQVVAEIYEQREAAIVETTIGPAVVSTFGTGDPLVFLSAGAGDAELWTLLGWLFREERTAVFIDLPVGTKQEALGTLTANAGNALGEVFDRLGIDAVDLVAGTFAGVIAMEFTASHPEQVRSLTLQGTAAQIRWSLFERMLLTIGRWLPGTLDSLPVWNRIAVTNHRPWFPPFDPSRWEFLRGNLARTNTAAYARCCAAWSRTNLEQRLTKINTPVLLIRSEGEGAATTPAMLQLERALPHARSEELHSSGLYPQVTHPHRVAKLLREFLGD